MSTPAATDPPGHDDLPGDHLNELAAVLLATSDIDTALHELAVAASRITPGAPLAAVTIRLGGRLTTVASSDEHARVLDEIPYDLDDSGGGPCRQALDTGEVVLAADLTAEKRWGSYAYHMVAHGVRSVYSIPLRPGQDVIGSLNMYAPTTAETAFDRAARAAIGRAATHTGLLLHAVLQAARHAEITAQLRQALTARATIDQATGILMGQRRCTASQAFTILRQASHHRNRRLRDVAADVITAFTGRPPEPAPFGDPP